MFESKIKLNKKKKYKSVNLSKNSLIYCSPYNQGCDGGYPFLVAKHGQEIGFYEDSCEENNYYS